MGQLEGKVAIVTGGGRGIGRAHALALAKEGAAVVVNDLGGEFSGEGAANSGPADKVVEEIKAAGGRAVADINDISDWDAAGGIVEAALSAFGRLDIVVNNAGISRFASIDKVTKLDWERTIAVNLTGTATLCHWAAAHWRAKGPEAGRRIVNTTSGVGLTPMPGNPMYASAKAGVAALTISCAIELAELGVRVNALSPVARSRISEFVAGDMMKQIPPGFDPLAPERVSVLATYLASPRCRFTGRVVGVIGDCISIYNGWSVAQHVGNGNSAWSLEALDKAIAEFPIQHEGSAQILGGVGPLLTPANELLEQLQAVEQA